VKNSFKVKTISTLVLAFVVAAGAGAVPVTLAEARKLAVEKSQTVAQAQLAVKSAKYGEISAQAEFLPSISGSGGLSASSADWAALTTTPSIGLSASQTLFSGGTRINALKSAQFTTTQNIEALRAARLSVIAETDTRFLDALKTKRTYETSLKDLEAAEMKLEIAKAKKEAGTFAETDFLSTQSSWATKKTASVQAKWAAAASERKLDSYLGKTVESIPLDDAEYGTLAKTVKEKAEADLDAFVKALYDKGRAADPGLRKKEAAVAIAELGVKTKTAAFFPTVSFSASVKSSKNASSDLRTDSSLGISASIPLFPISSRSSAVDIAKLSTETAVSLVASAEEDLRLSFYTTTLGILSAAGQIESADAALAYAEQNHKLALEKFRLGSGTISDLTDAEATLATARAQTINARFSLYAAVTDLGRLLGEEKEKGLVDALP